MSDIFISYKREEQATARKLADALESEGWTVWWAPKLRAGERFNDVIEKALKESKCVVVMWSKLSVESQYVKDEATYALNRNKLVPVMIDEVELPFRFEGLHTPSLLGWDGSKAFSEFRRLVDDISAILRTSTTSARAVPKDQPSREAEKQQMPTEKETKKSQQWAIAIASALIGVAGLVLVAFLTHWLTTGKEQQARERASTAERLLFYQQLKVHFDASFAAFNNQINLRDRLFESLNKRYGPLKGEYEPLFQKYYRRMNEDELRLCKQMRGITETLHSHNAAVRSLLKSHPNLYGDIPEFAALQEHLDLWISKYNHPFKDGEDQCLVYIGVAEEKGFPPGLDRKIEQRLSELKSHKS